MHGLIIFIADEISDKENIKKLNKIYNDGKYDDNIRPVKRRPLTTMMKMM